MADKIIRLIGLGALTCAVLDIAIGPEKGAQKTDNIATANAAVRIEDAVCRNYNQMAPELNFSPAYTLPDCKDIYLQ